MHITRDSFVFVPQQDFQKSWNDKILFENYKLDNSEINYIESMIRPME
jgi:site-specific DNA-methyltransferase (adenine-specific)